MNIASVNILDNPPASQNQDPPLERPSAPPTIRCEFLESLHSRKITKAGSVQKHDTEGQKKLAPKPDQLSFLLYIIRHVHRM